MSERHTKDKIGGRGGTWGTWTLVEALDFPRTPMTIMAIDGKLKDWSNPSRALGARTTELLANLHRSGPDSAAKDGAAPHSIVLDRDGTKSVICPIMGPEGKAHGYRIWIGAAEADPGPPPPAAGYSWDRETFCAHETYECAAMSGTSRQAFQAVRPVSDFTRRGVTIDMAQDLSEFAYNLSPGTKFSASLSVMHIKTGDIMPWLMALRPTSPTTANGIFYDFTPFGVEPRLPSDEELGMREFAEGADRYLAVVAIVARSNGVREMVLCTWITQPRPWVRYDEGAKAGTDYLHPADREEFCRHWSLEATISLTDLAARKVTRFPFRFAGWNPDEWVPVRAALRPYSHGGQGVVDNLFVMEVARETGPGNPT